MAGDKGAQFTFPSAFRGFYVYGRVWVSRLGQRLGSEREHDNAEDIILCSCCSVAVTEASPRHTSSDDWFCHVILKKRSIVIEIA